LAVRAGKTPKDTIDEAVSLLGPEQVFGVGSMESRSSTSTTINTATMMTRPINPELPIRI
jgi:hypothetical protein